MTDALTDLEREQVEAELAQAKELLRVHMATPPDPWLWNPMERHREHQARIEGEIARLERMLR